VLFPVFFQLLSISSSLVLLHTFYFGLNILNNILFLHNEKGSMDTQTILLAFGLTLILRAYSTGIGSVWHFLRNGTNTKFLFLTALFSAGVMIYVSFMEMMPEAKAGLIANYGERWGTLSLLLGFFEGWL
jgi:ZIP family zinc transporter